MKIVFIAGPYSGDGTKEVIEKNIREAEKYQIALANRGIGFFCPHNQSEHISQESTADEQFYRDLDFHFLLNVADAVLAVPGWENSEDAKRDVEWAGTNDMPVFYPTSPEEIGDIERWAEE